LDHKLATAAKKYVGDKKDKCRKKKKGHQTCSAEYCQKKKFLGCFFVGGVQRDFVVDYMVAVCMWEERRVSACKGEVWEGQDGHEGEKGWGRDRRAIYRYRQEDVLKHGNMWTRGDAARREYKSEYAPQTNTKGKMK
jgi:hypothetical protein